MIGSFKQFLNEFEIEGDTIKPDNIYVFDLVKRNGDAKVVYIRATSFLEAQEKVHMHNIYDYEVEPTTHDASYYGTYNDLDDFEKDRFMGDFAMFDPEEF